MNSVSFLPQLVGSLQSQPKSNLTKSEQSLSPFQALLNVTMSTEQINPINTQIKNNSKEAFTAEEVLAQMLGIDGKKMSAITEELLIHLSSAEQNFNNIELLSRLINEQKVIVDSNNNSFPEFEDVDLNVLQNLIDLFSQLADEIPIFAGYLKFDEAIENAISGFPGKFKSEIQTLFESNLSIEKLIENYRQSGSPHELVAVFLFFNQLQATGQVQFSANQQQVLTYQMQQLAEQVNQQQLPVELRQLIQRIVQQQTGEHTAVKKHSTNFIDQTLLSRQETSSQGLAIHSFANEQTVMSRAQQMTIHVGEQLTKEAEQQQFQRQFQEMMNRGLFRNLQNGLNQLSIKLYPEHLGRLDIQITQLNGVITARIMASTQVAKELIEGQLQNLRQGFAHQQLQVERIEVTQQEQGPLYQSARDEQSKGQQGHQEQRQTKEQQDENETFSELLEEFTFMEKV